MKESLFEVMPLTAPTGKIFKLILPRIRDIDPESIVNNIVGVQPMQSNISDLYSLNISYEPHVYNFGDLIHSFIYGWQVWDNHDFIDYSRFVEIYGCDCVNRW